MATDYYTDTSQDSLSTDELRLYQLIMDYRASLGLPGIPLSLGLTITAGRHALDQIENMGGASGHSWSDAPYNASDEATYPNMWLAPDRLGTTYQSDLNIDYYGYEISIGGGGPITPEIALAGWRGSTAHNDVMTNRGDWATFEWNAIGIGIHETVAHVWFGVGFDIGGYPEGAPVLPGFGNEIDGTPGPDFLDGTTGIDIIRGLADVDTLIGRAGNDTLDGGTGADFMYGGEGDDTYHVDDTFDVVDEGFGFPEFGAGGSDSIVSTANWFWDVYSIAERVTIADDATDPTGAGTTIVAGAFNNEIFGNASTNILFGRGGSDSYTPGDGIDYVSLSTLGLTDENAYPGVDGFNTIIVQPRKSGPVSYDIIFEFEPGKDTIYLFDYEYASIDEVLSQGFNDGLGNSYYILGDGFDYLYMIGLEVGDIGAGDIFV